MRFSEYRSGLEGLDFPFADLDAEFVVFDFLFVVVDALLVFHDFVFASLQFGRPLL